jgi:hypothetical protein
VLVALGHPPLLQWVCFEGTPFHPVPMVIPLSSRMIAKYARREHVRKVSALCLHTSSH